MPDTLMDTDILRAAVQLACRAPSLHNSQPWQWVSQQHPRESATAAAADEDRLGRLRLIEEMTGGAVPHDPGMNGDVRIAFPPTGQPLSEGFLWDTVPCRPFHPLDAEYVRVSPGVQGDRAGRRGPHFAMKRVERDRSGQFRRWRSVNAGQYQQLGGVRPGWSRVVSACCERPDRPGRCVGVRERFARRGSGRMPESVRC